MAEVGVTMPEVCGATQGHHPGVYCHLPEGHSGPHQAQLFPSRPDWITWT